MKIRSLRASSRSGYLYGTPDPWQLLRKTLRCVNLESDWSFRDTDTRIVSRLAMLGITAVGITRTFAERIGQEYSSPLCFRSTNDCLQVFRVYLIFSTWDSPEQPPASIQSASVLATSSPSKYAPCKKPYIRR